MKRNKRLSENLGKRKNIIEVTVRNRKKIDRTKYYGIKKLIKEYSNTIKETLFNEEKLKEAIKKQVNPQESLNDYFNDLNEELYKALDKIKQFIEETAKKSSKRVLTKSGKAVKFEEIKDSLSIDFLASQQIEYIENITNSQRQKIIELLTDGIEKGKSIQEISETIVNEIKHLTDVKATMIARTELIKTSALSQVETMKRYGAKTYIYWTAGDRRVCKVCKKLQGSRENPNIYDINLAGKSSPIPVISSHPNCRCVILIND